MGIFSWSTISTIVFIGYIGITLQKLYQLMNPLYGVEINPDDPTINPIWQANQTFSMICYLSTTSRVSPSFNLQEIARRKLLLWHQPELTFNQLQKELTYDIRIIDEISTAKSNSASTVTSTKVNRTYVASSEMWSKLRHNESTIFLHVLVTTNKQKRDKTKVNKISDTDAENNNNNISSNSTDSTDIADSRSNQDESIEQSSTKPSPPSQGDVLYGSVKLVKYDKIPKAFRHRYLLSDFGLVNVTHEEARKASMSADTVISYWKPEVAVRLVTDLSVYPYELIPDVLHRHIFESNTAPSATTATATSTTKQQQRHHKIAQKHFFYKPPIHVDEIGLTSDKYIPLNATVTELPLKLTYDSMSLQRWLLMQNVEQSLSSQKNVGFTDKDIDDVRRLISDTSIYLLGITILASLLHLLFEFLAFQSDITFWRENKSLAGLSTRTVVTDLFSQIIIFLFLLESDTSMLVIIPSFFGILIQAWKVQKATGFGIVRNSKNGWLFGYSLEFSRWKASSSDSNSSSNENSCSDGNSGSSTISKVAGTGNRENTTTAATVNATSKDDSASKTKKVNKKGSTAAVVANDSESKAIDSKITTDTTAAKTANTPNTATTATASTGISDEELTAATLAADQMATSYLGLLLLPIALLMSLRSLLVDKHASWYSWGIGSLTGVVYTFGFVLMCPQLFINHKLKSVAALPWKFLIYKFLNTFIDDLFAFIIKMPTMHRLSVFRDDIVFLVYIYQRWIYRIDTSRPVDK